MIAEGQASAAESTTDRLREKVSEAVQSVQDMGNTAKGFAQEKLEEVRESVGESVGHYYEQGRAKAKEIEHTLESMVRQQPVKALMIAVGVGLILGGLMIRR